MSKLSEKVAMWLVKRHLLVKEVIEAKKVSAYYLERATRAENNAKSLAIQVNKKHAMILSLQSSLQVERYKREKLEKELTKNDLHAMKVAEVAREEINNPTSRPIRMPIKTQNDRYLSNGFSGVSPSTDLLNYIITGVYT